MHNQRFVGLTKYGVSGIILAGVALGGAPLSVPGSRANSAIEERTVAVQSKFYCNINALNPAERAHLRELGEKLRGSRKDIVETEKGYEFQYSPANVSLAEIVDWVSLESKCCPFFDFHIDLEKQASLLCLRLTGEEGVKEFIRTEFSLGKK